MKNLLIFPPHWSPTHPYLSLPTLSAYLKKNNISVEQLDLNIESFHYFLSKKFLLECKEKCLENKKFDKKDYNEIDAKHDLLYQYIINNIEESKKILKNKEGFYKIENYKKASSIIKKAFKMISKAYSPTVINLNTVRFVDKMNVDKVDSLLKNKSVNPFINFYKNTIKDINFKNIKFIGISLVAFEQIIPTFTLCKLIKEKHPSIHICIGGSVFTKLKDKMDKYKKIFDYIDTIILFEGEYPLLKLINAVNNNESFNTIPNCVYKEENKIISTDINKNIIPIQDLPVPNFDGFQLDKYMSPDIIVPYYMSRSCFWGKCSFCDHDYGYDGEFRLKKIDKIIKDIQILKEKYDIECIHFIDEAISPKTLLNFSKEINNKKINISWFNYIKANNSFTDEICNEMRKAGCVQVMIGVESCSDKILKDMNKGITLNNIETTLTNLNKNGIWSHVFLINNFPTETDKDKLQTLLFILSNKTLFHSIGISDFTLNINSKMMNYKEKYYIKNIEEISDFSNFYNYTSYTGTENLKENTKILQTIYSENIESNRFANLIMYREHIPLFNKEYKLIKNKKKIYTLIKRLDDKKYMLFDKIVYKSYKDKLLILETVTFNAYIVPKFFESILEFTQKNNSKYEIIDYLESFISNKKTKQNIINFLDQQLNLI